MQREFSFFSFEKYIMRGRRNPFYFLIPCRIEALQKGGAAVILIFISRTTLKVDAVGNP